MQKNWKESEFFKKLKHIRVNRAVYLSAIIVLLSISVVLIVTAVNNRANKPSVNTTTPPPVTEAPKPQETTPPPQTNENDKPTQGNTIPEFALPVGGVLSQKHSVDTQVFSPTLNEYRVQGADMVDMMVAEIREETTRAVLTVTPANKVKRVQIAKPVDEGFEGDGPKQKKKVIVTVRKGEKIGRNDPCPCGSGKKYKFCCGSPSKT